ncbi:MAG: T9SS type A sorting domain-containing protein [Bacteroidales bacterium]
MKKSMILLGFLVCTFSLVAQSYATLRLGSMNANALFPGDTIAVPIICDDINPGAVVVALQFVFNYDHDVLEWNDSIQIYFGDCSDGWMINDDGTQMTISWIDPTFCGGQPIIPGSTLCEIYFIYLGGETGLNWQVETIMHDQSFNYFYLGLINGCVCNFENNAVNFHVTGNGFDLENAVVTVGGQSDTTNATGHAEFLLPDGDYMYTVTKSGFAGVEDSITVAGAPVQVEVEMEVCSDVNFHIVSFSGAITGCVITIGNYIFNTDTMSTVCLPAGTYSFSVSKPGYYTFTGTLTAPFGPDILVVILIPFYYDVTFFVNCCGEPLENYPISIEGQTAVTNAAGIAVMNLPSGFYSFEIGGFPVTFTLPDTTYVEVDICSEVTFHVTSDGEPIEGASVTVDDETIATNSLGEAVFCLQNGTYIYTIYKPGYGTTSGILTVNSEPVTVEIIWLEPFFPVTFNIIGLPCNNSFDDIFIEINGDTVSSGETTILTIGNYLYSVYLTGCIVPIESGNIEVSSASLTIDIELPVLPHATFHVSSTQVGNISNAEIIIDGDTLYTNSSGVAAFCITGGEHYYTVRKENYDTIFGSFEFLCQDVTVNILMDPVLVNDQNSSEIRLYPNPTDGRFYLENLNASEFISDITIKDITGRIVYQKKPITAEKIEIDMKNQPKGIYFLSAGAGEMIWNEKLVIR